MNRLRLKSKFKTLIKVVGGLEDAVDACRDAAERGEGRLYSKAQLARCYDPEAPDYPPVDIVLILEAHCGQNIVSRAMAEARPTSPIVGDIRDEAGDAIEAFAALHAGIRKALADGDGISTTEARELLALFERGKSEADDIAVCLAGLLGARS